MSKRAATLHYSEPEKKKLYFQDYGSELSTMISYSKKVKNDHEYYKVQLAQCNIEYTSGKMIRNEELKFKTDEHREVVYKSKTFASEVNDRMRVTTCDQARFKNPCYKYDVVTYDEISNASYSRLIAGKTLEIIDCLGSKYAIVYFDLETAGLGAEDDILQVSVKCGKSQFDSYVDPTRPVSEEATNLHDLTASGNDLFLNGARIKSLPLELVLLKVLYFLKNLNTQCILVAHNTYTFFMPRLLRALDKFNFLGEFKKVAAGFFDTLPHFKEKYPGRTNGYELLTLASDFGIPWFNLYNTKYNVQIITDLVNATFDTNEIIDKYRPLNDCLLNYHRNERARIEEQRPDKVYYMGYCEYTNVGKDETISILSSEIENTKTKF